MIPRFNYTLPFLFYIKNLFCFFRNSSGEIKLNLYNKESVYYINSARTGLRLLLSSITNKKLKVGVQVFTCHTILQAITKAGHEIVFLDITNDFGLDLNFLKTKINQMDVLIVTHTFGLPDNWDSIKEIAKGKIIIEDCAHSYLSKYKEKYLGTLGDAAIFSFGLGKFPPIGTGGLVLVNNPEKFPNFQRLYEDLPQETFSANLIQIIKLLALSILMHRPLYGLITYRIGKKLDKKFDFGDKYSFQESKGFQFGKFIYSYNDKYFKENANRNRQNLQYLSDNNNKFSCLFKENLFPNYYIIPILYDERDWLYNMFLRRNIETGKHFSRSIEWAKEFGYQNDCESVEIIVDKILTIPAYWTLREKDLKRMILVLKTFTNEKNDLLST